MIQKAMPVLILVAIVLSIIVSWQTIQKNKKKCNCSEQEPNYAPL